MYYSLRIKRIGMWAFACFCLFACIAFMQVRTLRTPKVCESTAFTQATIPEASATPGEDLVVYLTFDDGPSKITEELLDVLKSYNVHATFFVVTNLTENYHHLLKRMVEEGHCVALHSHSHRYKTIYKDEASFFADLELEAQIIYDACGVRPKVFRFPGGSSNSIGRRYGGQRIMQLLIQEAMARGLTYVDWNVSGGDANGTRCSAGTVAHNVIKGCNGRRQAVVLLHDTARTRTTLEAMPEIIEALLAQGYRFDTVNNMDQPVQHIKADEGRQV